MLEAVKGAVRQAGLQPLVLRPDPEVLVSLQLPLVVELRDGRYLLLTELGKKSATRIDEAILFSPSVENRQDTVVFNRFQQAWTGGVFYSRR